jgi:hypothetical protein
MNSIANETPIEKELQPSHKTVGTTERAVSIRAQLLAERIELGADGLASFAAGLSETEWNTPVSETDRRSVGLIVHHVASMYPIEIEVARGIAKGKAVTDVTWDVVARLNAQVALENAGVTKAAALELLRQNSRQAANAVRTFSEDELHPSRHNSSLRITRFVTAGTIWLESEKPWGDEFQRWRGLNTRFGRSSYHVGRNRKTSLAQRRRPTSEVDGCLGASRR